MQIKLPAGSSAKRLFVLLRTTSFGVFYYSTDENEVVRCFNIFGQAVWLKLTAGNKNCIDFSLLTISLPLQWVLFDPCKFY